MIDYETGKLKVHGTSGAWGLHLVERLPHVKYRFRALAKRATNIMALGSKGALIEAEGHK